MQKDMHYYGTYAMARAAGIEQDSAKIIATASQFVDDNAIENHIEFLDGGRIDTEATAHHTISGANIDKINQRKVWVPFHFLPGNEGDHYHENMICRKDSDIAREMVKNNLSYSNRAYARELIGITAHVYADTFSHHGFSGFSSEVNKIDNDTLKVVSQLSVNLMDYIQKKKEHFIDRLQSEAAENLSQGLGHGAVLTYPDRPYLKWRFTYENGRVAFRDNPKDFFDGCKALHAMFIEFSARNEGFKGDQGLPFDQIADVVRRVLAVEGNKEERSQAWRDAATSGKLFASGKETIPEYDLAAWEQQWEALRSTDDSSEAIGQNIYCFYQAASTHRNYVLRDLLPSYLLIAH